MFCPRCGQQQVSDEMRYCSRCGLPLGAVARVVEGGGLAEGEEAAATTALSPRQRGTRMGLLVMAAAFALGVVTVFLSMLKEDFFVLFFVAALGFTFGVIRMLYGLLLEDDARPRPAADPARATALNGSPRAPAAALNPARTPAADFTRTRTQTAEMAPAPSVTENTTRLLEDEER